MGRFSKKTILIAILVALVMCALLCIIVALVSDDSEKPESAPPAEATTAIEATVPKPTITQKPTRTPKPTDTPVLPTSTPVPPTATAEPTEEPKAEIPIDVRLYMLDVSATTDKYARALIELGGLLQKPDMASDSWVIDVAVQMVIIKSLYSELQETDVPAEMTEIHEALLRAGADFYASMEHLTIGIDDLDADEIELAIKLMESGNAHIGVATGLTNEYAARFE